MKTTFVFSLFLLGTLACQAASQLPSTSYTRDWLRSANAGEGRSKLGITTTNGAVNTTQLEAPATELQIKAGAALTNPVVNGLKIGSGGFTNRTVAWIITNAVPSEPSANGSLATDTTTGALYVRTNNAWVLVGSGTGALVNAAITNALDSPLWKNITGNAVTATEFGNANTVRGYAQDTDMELDISGGNLNIFVSGITHIQGGGGSLLVDKGSTFTEGLKSGWGFGYTGLIASGAATNVAGSRVAYLSDVGASDPWQVQFGTAALTNLSNGTGTGLTSLSVGPVTNALGGAPILTNCINAAGPISATAVTITGDGTSWSSVSNLMVGAWGGGFEFGANTTNRDAKTAGQFYKVLDSNGKVGPAAMDIATITNNIPKVITNSISGNVYYSTNLSTLSPNWDLPYSTITTNDAFVFLAPLPPDSTRFNQCVIFVTNSAATYKAVTAPANVHSQGTWAITNVSAFTWTYYPPLGTNAICLPLW